MSVVGVDFGTLNTVIAVARNRGVDVITNEVSNRATPSLVGFGPRARYLGETAKSLEISNLKNTVSCLKRLAGRSLKDPDVQIEQQYVSAALVECGAQVGAEVSYLGKKEKFSATELVAMFLSKVKQTAQAELKLPVSDIVMSVPAWFTDVQRRSLMDASEIAGLKMLRLMNDTTAAALGWGITKLDLPGPEEKPRRVAIIDIGHSDYTCSIIDFKKGELAVKSTACDRHFGGRDFNLALVNHFQKEFLAKYKIDITTNPKAMAPMNIESLMNDVDVSGMVTRQEFEALIEPMLLRVTKPIEQALAEAKLTKEDIDVIELVGGCTRVPALKDRIQAYFGKQLSFTMNQDEAIARGCAFSCAILSPVFKVRDFAILTFYRKQAFDLEARYAKPEILPGKVQPFIGRFSVKGVKADPKTEFMICKLKARVNIHGVLNVESGYYVEDQEVEEEVKDEEGDKKDPEAMETDGDKKDPKTKTRKVKKQVRKGDLPIVADTEERKNELEAYIYEMRNKLDEQYAELANDDEKDKIRAKLTETEDWLYEDGEDATKAVYVAKIDEIRAMAGPIAQRHFDKVEAEREALQAKLDAEAAAKKANEEEAKKQAEPAKDEVMTDAEAPQPETEAKE
ncbi:heat shock protein 88 [Apiospora phragmitis]|uniref:Heat shock protein 88 n=1 Tax=Apiospora phragmitis TaxID=2905665 RepID=A0ABR1T9N2_9PEZI